MDQLLQHLKTDFAVVQSVAEVASLEDPSRRNPTQWQPGKLLDMTRAARAVVSDDGHVRLLRDLVFCQHGAAVFSTIPDRDEVEFHVRVVLHDLCPPAAFEFRLAIGTPRRPKVDYRQTRSFGGFGDLLFCLPPGQENGGKERGGEKADEKMLRHAM